MTRAPERGGTPPAAARRAPPHAASRRRRPGPSRPGPSRPRRSRPRRHRPAARSLGESPGRGPRRARDFRVTGRTRARASEVERGRRLAESAAAGRRIERVECAADAIVYAGASPAEWEALGGRRVLAACRWGKQLWFDPRRAAAPALPLRDVRRLPGAGGQPPEARLRPRPPAGGVAAPVLEGPSAFRRRRRAGDDRRPASRPPAASRRAARGAAGEPPRLRPAACPAFAPALRRASRRPLRDHQVAAPRPGCSRPGSGTGSRTKSSTRPASTPGAGRGTSTTGRRSGFAPCSGGWWRRRCRSMRRAAATPRAGSSIAAGGSGRSRRPRAGDTIRHIEIGGRTTAWVPTVQR